MYSGIATIVVSLSLLGTDTGAEKLPPYSLGKPISTAILLDLTNPERSGYRIGIVNAEAATGILLRRQDFPAAVEYIDGADSFLWAQAAEQLPSARLESRLRYSINRRKFDAGICAGLPPLIAAFQAELDAVFARHTSVMSPAPKKYQAIGPNGLEEVAVDGTRFWIQVAQVDATLIVTPDSGSDPLLQRATGNLHSVLSECANSVKPTLEEHDF